MDHVARLQLISKVSYYAAWVFAFCGALAHFGVVAIFRSMELSQRNLFEGSLMFFLISAVSVLRAGAVPKAN
jgi:hypothetical protein